MSMIFLSLFFTVYKMCPLCTAVEAHTYSRLYEIDAQSCSVSPIHLTTLSCVDCLEDKGKIIRTVLCCIVSFGCQYQCNRLPGKTRLWNDLLCVEWDVKPYTLIHSLTMDRYMFQVMYFNFSFLPRFLVKWSQICEHFFVVCIQT